MHCQVLHVSRQRLQFLPTWISSYLPDYGWWKKSCTSWYGKKSHNLGPSWSRIYSISVVSQWFGNSCHWDWRHILLYIISDISTKWVLLRVALVIYAREFDLQHKWQKKQNWSVWGNHGIPELTADSISGGGTEDLALALAPAFAFMEAFGATVECKAAAMLAFALAFDLALAFGNDGSCPSPSSTNANFRFDPFGGMWQINKSFARTSKLDPDHTWASTVAIYPQFQSVQWPSQNYQMFMIETQKRKHRKHKTTIWNIQTWLNLIEPVWTCLNWLLTSFWWWVILFWTELSLCLDNILNMLNSKLASLA